MLIILFDGTDNTDMMKPGFEREASTISRRSYLGMVGVAIGGATTAKASASTEYERVTVSEGERKTVYLEDGETLENVLFDVTATGASVSINARKKTEWTIRNVAIRGQVDMDEGCVLCVSDSAGGTSRIENVWIGDGAKYAEGNGIGLWVGPEHSGHLDVERVNVQDMADNAFYCSAPGDEGGGTVALRNCYAANCGITHYRLSEGTIENCVASVTDSRKYRQGRGVWAWSPGPVEVRGCDFDMNGHHYSFLAGANEEPSDILVSDTQWDDEFYDVGWREQDGGTVQFEENNGNDPRNRLPKGCPKSIIDVLPGEVGEISIEDQTSSGGTVAVERAAYDPDDFVVIVETESGDVVGRSEPIAGGTIGTDLTIDLDPSLEETQTITATAYDADDGAIGEPIEIDGQVVDDTAVVTVDGAGDDPVDDYRNEDGKVDTEGLRDAVDDWRSGDNSTDVLRDVVDAWRTSGSGET